MPVNEVRAVLRGIFEASPSGYARQLAGPVCGLVDETFSGVVGSAAELTTWLANPAFANLVSGSSFKPKDLLGGKVCRARGPCREGATMSDPRQLAVLAVHRGLLSQQQFDQAVALCGDTSLSDWLRQRGWLSEEQLRHLGPSWRAKRLARRGLANRACPAVVVALATFYQAGV